jgi:long-chain acyl-CoA synthetase
LARAECIASIEQSLGIEFKPEEATAAQTVGELVQFANGKMGDGTPQVEPIRAGLHWNDVLSEKSERLSEVDQLLRRKSIVASLAFVVLQSIDLISRVLFRLEVTGKEVLTGLKPYLICPNHQSYIDPFLVCSTYPRNVLQEIFHVGASLYFTNVFMAQLARLISVVPIDPDLQLVRAMRVGAAGLRAGKILNIYPEGQRSFDGQLLEFKKGAAVLAAELNLPIVPVALDGAYGIWPRRSWRFRLAKVKIKFGEPIYARDVVPDEKDMDIAYEKVTEVLRERILDMLSEMRR